jgi:hypothetical protein
VEFQVLATLETAFLLPQVDIMRADADADFPGVGDAAQSQSNGDDRP